jgi:hypothetical protein
MDEGQVRALLDLEAGTEAPPSRVDVERARGHGRRRLRWRRTSLAGSSVLAVIAVVVATVAASGSSGAGPGPGNAPAAHGQVPAVRQFSLLSPHAAFGWLPSGDSLEGGTISPTSVYLTAGPSAAWALTVYVAGFCNLSSEQVLRQLGQHQQPQLMCATSAGGSGYPVTGEAPPVDGLAAFWDGYGDLVWQYAAGSWAVLSQPKKAATSVTIKVADNISYDAPDLVKFPVQLTDLPAAWQLANVHFEVDTGLLLAVQYALTAASANVPAPLVTASPGSDGTCWYSPNGQSARQTINGYPVTVSNIPASNGNPPTQEVCASNADGLMVSLDTYGSETPDAVSIFSSHMRLLGANPANWTTDPLG